MSSNNNSAIPNQIIRNEEKVQLNSNNANEMQLEANTRIKRVGQDRNDKVNIIISNNQSQNGGLVNKVINQDQKDDKTEELIDVNFKIENIRDLTEEKKNKLYRKFKELRNIISKELQESQEYFLLSNNWYNSIFREIIHNSINLKESNLNIDNNDILINKEIFDNALFLDGEKQLINIIKPKYEFYQNIKPFKLYKKFWKFFQNIFGGGPEIKMLAQKEENQGKITYRQENLPYIKINCIILPTKNLEYSEDNYKKEIQTFYFYFNRFKKINELTMHLKEIIKSHPKIKIIDINNIKCWIDLNYDDFGVLIKRINNKISEIFNMNNNNSLSPLDLEQLEKQDEKNEKINNNKDKNNSFGFKLFPLNIFSNEQTMNIFPNQFTDNFEKLNKNMLERKIARINMFGMDNSKIIDSYEINKYPELNIIIEQIVGSVFSKSNNIKYKIDACANCNTKGILTIFCECLNKFYCSYKCKLYNRKNHEEECPNLLLNHFLEMNEKIKITEETILGTKGIRNIGNTCYMNTAIQCLSNCSELRNYFLFGNPIKDINKNNILGYRGLVAHAFENLMKKLWFDKEKVIDISKFKNAMGVCNERFLGMNQQDTHEFATFLIDALHEDLNRVKLKNYISKDGREMNDEIKSKIEWNNYLRRNQSILIDLFYGIFKSTVTCQECKKSCVDFNVFSSLSLNLTNYKKKASNDLNNKINNLNLDSTEKKVNKIENNENENKENEIKQKNDMIKNLNIKIRTENISIHKNEKMEIIDSPPKKEEILVGGKEKESEIENESSQDQAEKNEIIKINIAFYFCSSEEKPIQFILSIKDKTELTYKALLYKVSKIFNKNPYSLYLYHIDKDRNIKKVYGTNNSELYDIKNDKTLLISEISVDTINNNLSKATNNVFFESSIINYNKVKFTSREKLETFCKKNKDNIIKAINEKIDYSSINDQILLCHYLNLEEIFQFTLKNYVFENEKDKYSYTNFPKIVVFSKNITIFNLYIELFKRKKNIILGNNLINNNNNNNKQIDSKKIINDYFKALFITKENFDSKTIFEKENLPFYLTLQKYNYNKNEEEKGIELLLNDEDKNKKIKEILNIETIDFPKEQICLNIFWNQKYNEQLKQYLRREKLDSFLNNLMGIDEKEKTNKGNIIGSENQGNKKLTDEEIRANMKNRWDNVYEQTKNVSSINNNNSNIKYLNSNNNTPNRNIKKESNKNENFIQINPEISLVDSFEILREEEILDGNNEWFCENCKKKQKAIKKIEIYNSPKILIIQIKRFNHYNKINTKVNFPLKDLDINNYIISNKNNSSIKYDLFAVANHYGSLNYGHYTAFCKNSLTNKWYHYNDSMVTEINDESLIISSNAYVLFYRQKGLSNLNWNDIYNKKFIDININDQNSLIDFNFDFINNSKGNTNENKLDEEKMKIDEDFNEFDQLLKNKYSMKKLEKLEKTQKLNKDYNNPKINNNSENYINNKNVKESNNFLNKKRNSSDSK